MTVTREYIDQLLDTTAVIGEDIPSAQARAWRDELAHVAVVLSYARHVLSVDLSVLERLAETADDSFQALVDALPEVLAAASIGGGWSLSPDAPATTESAARVVQGEADGLLGAHGELTRVDITSPTDVENLRRTFEEELSQVTERWKLVEARLRTLQALLVEMYKSGEASVDDWLR